jgi:hypothetical protein
MLPAQRQDFPRAVRLVRQKQGFDVAQPVLAGFRTGFEGCDEVRQPSGRLLSLHFQLAELVVRLGVTRLRLDDRTIELLGFTEVASGVAGERLCQGLSQRLVERHRGGVSPGHRRWSPGDHPVRWACA